MSNNENRSAYPDDAPNSWSDEAWEESSKECEDCNMLVWEAKWYDDPPRFGGACIGTKYECGNCGWVDSA